MIIIQRTSKFGLLLQRTDCSRRPLLRLARACGQSTSNVCAYASTGREIRNLHARDAGTTINGTDSSILLVRILYSFKEKPIYKVLPFCPRATAEGMAGSRSAVHRRAANLETGEKDTWIYGASFARTSAVFICRRLLKPKGRGQGTEGRPQDAQGCEFRALSKRQGW